MTRLAANILVRKPYYWKVPPVHLYEFRVAVQDLLKTKVTREFCSLYASSFILVLKKDSGLSNIHRRLQGKCQDSKGCLPDPHNCWGVRSTSLRTQTDFRLLFHAAEKYDVKQQPEIRVRSQAIQALNSDKWFSSLDLQFAVTRSLVFFYLTGCCLDCQSTYHIPFINGGVLLDFVL